MRQLGAKEALTIRHQGVLSSSLRFATRANSRVSAVTSVAPRQRACGDQHIVRPDRRALEVRADAGGVLGINPAERKDLQRQIGSVASRRSAAASSCALRQAVVELEENDGTREVAVGAEASNRVKWRAAVRSRRVNALGEGIGQFASQRPHPKFRVFAKLLGIVAAIEKALVSRVRSNGIVPPLEQEDLYASMFASVIPWRSTCSSVLRARSVDDCQSAAAAMVRTYSSS